MSRSLNIDVNQALHSARCADIAACAVPASRRPIDRLEILVGAENKIRTISNWATAVREVAKADPLQGVRLAADGAFWAHSDHRAWGSPHAERLEQVAADLVSELVMQPVKSAGPRHPERLAAHHEALDRLQDVLLTTPPPPGSKLEACSEDLTRRLLTGLSRLDPEAGKVAAMQCNDIYTTRVDVLVGFGPFSGRHQVASEIRTRQLKPGLAAYRVARDF